MKKIRPVYTMVLLTCDRYEDSGLYLPGSKLLDSNKTSKKGGNVKEIQKVVAVGSSVREVKPGDIVSVSLGNFAVRKYVEGGMHDNIQDMKNDTVEFRIPVVECCGETLMYIDERDISYVVEDYEEAK